MKIRSLVHNKHAKLANKMGYKYLLFAHATALTYLQLISMHLATFTMQTFRVDSTLVCRNFVCNQLCLGQRFDSIQRPYFSQNRSLILP